MSESSADIRILLIDDHPIVRQGYRRVLESQPNFTVVGEAENAVEAYKLYKTLTPDVVVMDISMPGASGLEAIRNMHLRDRNVKVLVFSMHGDAMHIRAAFDAGAIGYVTKSSPPKALVNAVRAVHRGERTMSEDAAHTVALASVEGGRAAAAALNSREVEIARQIAAGATKEQIAANLNVSVKTVQNYHYAIKSKLNVTTDAQLVRAVLQRMPGA